MNIHEPTTLVTDLLLFVLGIYLARRLAIGPEHPSCARKAWVLSLTIMALSALVGGLYHGFAPNFSESLAINWWRLVLWLMCLMSFTMDLSLIFEIPLRNTLWKVMILAKLLLSATAVLISPTFTFAILSYGSTMLVWGLAGICLRRSWSKWMLTGVGLSGISAWIQQSEIGFGKHFNHNDLFHVIQGLAIVAFYFAGKTFGKSALKTPSLNVKTS
ncbi:MAG: hypothetical protein AB8D78_00950 [Akkermansiaceae bacterium]